MEAIQRLQGEVEGLKQVAAGQAAMIALLVGTLVDKGVLKPEDAVLIPAAALDTQGYKLTPREVQEWMKREIGKRRQPQAGVLRPEPHTGG